MLSENVLQQNGHEGL